MNPASLSVARLDLLGPILNEGLDFDAFMAHKILPPIKVSNKAGVIPSFLNYNAQSLNLKHTPKTNYAEIVGQLSSGSYQCNEAGLEQKISAEDYDAIPRPKVEALVARQVAQGVLRGRELALASMLFSSAGATMFTNAGTNVAAAHGWSLDTSNPMQDVLNAKNAVAKRTGRKPNKIAMGYGLYVRLMGNATFQARVRAMLVFQGAPGESATTEIDAARLAQVFGVDEVILGSANYNKQIENKRSAADNFDYVWDDEYCLVFCAPTKADTVDELCFGRMFVYDQAEILGQLATGEVNDALAMILEQYRREDLNCDVLRAREFTGMSVLVPYAAALITGCRTAA